jgi:cytoskeleton-associated protein 5
MMPLGRGTKPVNSPPFDAVSAAINDIRQESPERAVDALKHLQDLLTQTPHFFEDSVETLLDALLDEFDRAFTRPERLHDTQHTRMVKHLMQTFSCITCNSNLIRRLDANALYPLMAALLRRLIQADRLGGTIAEMGKFMNLIVIQAMSTPERITVYTAMFRLVAETFKDFDVNYPDESTEVADHAELLLKCLWKRAKVMEEDFRAGRLQVGKLLVVLEEFLENTGPQEWSRRKKAGVFLGDMPLKTVKSFLQKAMSESFIGVSAQKLMTRLYYIQGRRYLRCSVGRVRRCRRGHYCECCSCCMG